MDDLLGIYPAPAPTPSPASSIASGVYGGGGAASAASGGLDIFGSPVSTASASGPLDIASAPLPASIAPAVPAGTRREPAAANVQAASDGTVAIGYHKIFAPDALHLAVFVGNTTLAPLASATVGFQGAPHLAASSLRATQAAGAPVTGGAGAPSQISLGSLAPRSIACVVISYSLAALPPGPSHGLVGGVQYATSSGLTAPPVTFTVEVTGSDLVRPAPMDTPAFGGQWTQPAMRGEAALTVPTSVIRSSADMMAVAAAQWNCHPVQALPATNEGIAAGRIAAPPSSPPAYVLVHCRIPAPGSVEIRVKTVDPTLTAAILGSFAAAVKAR